MSLRKSRFFVVTVATLCCFPNIAVLAQTTEGSRIFAGTNSTQVVRVNQSGTGFGLRAFTPSTKAVGAVFGQATGTSGFTNGVWGQNNSRSGVGVRGEAKATSGAATGVAGFSGSPDGTAVFG